MRSDAGVVITTTSGGVESFMPRKHLAGAPRETKVPRTIAGGFETSPGGHGMSGEPRRHHRLVITDCRRVCSKVVLAIGIERR
jgi:hypothetical protein